MFAVLIHGHGIMGRVKQKLIGFERGEIRSKAEENFTKTVGIMFGCRVKKCEQGQVTLGIGQDIHIITKIPFFAGGIPTDVTIRLRKESVAGTVKYAFFDAITGMMRPHSLGSNDRGSIPSKAESIRMNHTSSDGFRDKARRKDIEYGLVGFVFHVKSCGRKPGD